MRLINYISFDMIYHTKIDPKLCYNKQIYFKH